jgi:hypothetical protein
LYRGIRCDDSKHGYYYTLVRSPSPSFPLSLLLTSLKAIARGFFVLSHISVL